MELHRTIMRAAMDRSITDTEYEKILELCLDEMDRIGITEQEVRQIESDIADAVSALGPGPVKAVG
jgi:hypothetical protein